MNYKGFEQNKCRICLNQDIIVHWNETLRGYSNFSYKECYYKYTQMECVENFFPCMLCQNCSNGLEYIHNFILKAVETHEQLMESNRLSILKNSGRDIDTIYSMELDMQNGNEEEEIKLKPYILSPEELYIESAQNTKVDEILPITYGLKCNSELKTENESEKEIDTNPLILRPEELSVIPEDTKIDKKVKRQYKQNSIKSDVINKEDEKNNSDNLVKTVKSPRSRSRKKTKCEKTPLSLKESLKTKPLSVGEQPICCSICSKVLSSKYKAIIHEQTHIENRERKETCTVCGLKLLNKACLYSHMRTHADNRKKHECEFCNKAFYNMGNLNIHKRIHLGQMIPCSLCSKKFFRQIDLDKHMSSHSATRITAETMERKKIYVQCKECDKTMLSTNFKAHRAKHLNEPLVKCSICSKEYYSRHSLRKHLKKQHQILKGSGEYVTVIKEGRMSHLLLEQTTDIQKSNK